MTSMKETNETFRRLSAEDEEMYQNPRCTFKGVSNSCWFDGVLKNLDLSFEGYSNVSLMLIVLFHFDSSFLLQAQLSQPPISVDFENFAHVPQKELKDATSEVLKSIKLPRPFAV